MSATDKEARDAAIRTAMSMECGEHFPGWLLDHWPVFKEFERMARYAIERGRTRLSAKHIFEVIRWHTQLADDTPYKLNNIHTPDCARLFDALNPELAGRFEFRVRGEAINRRAAA